MKPAVGGRSPGRPDPAASRARESPGQASHRGSETSLLNHPCDYDYHPSTSRRNFVVEGSESKTIDVRVRARPPPLSEPEIDSRVPLYLSAHLTRCGVSLLIAPCLLMIADFGSYATGWEFMR